ncbi:MAG TPA: hypothetical protein VHY35_20110 [Stellaceae bacterium]|nr:hypothetical protein [Stellaceae bacterium]
MRLTCALGTALLLVCLSPVASRAASSATANLMSHPMVVACDAPVANPNARRHRRVRHVRHYVHRYHRWRRPMVAYLPPPPPPPPVVVYNPWLPDPRNTGYDRAMTLHYQSAPVSGVYGLDAGLPPTPPVAGIHPYRMQAGAAVVQYDGLTGEYIPLSQYDAQRVVAAGPLPVALPR